MWNRWGCFNGKAETTNFTEGKPWLLRFFDQIRFYPVSAEELLQMRADFPHGKFKLNIEEKTFSLKEYNAFLKAESATVEAFKAKQQAAFDAERERWIADGQANYTSDAEVANDLSDVLVLGEGSRAVASHVAGNLWQVQVKEGDTVQAGDVVVIVESMKMEIAVTTPCAGTVSKVLCSAGSAISAGQNLVVIEE
jgi:urea carboxylase